MLVREIMTENPEVCTPETSLQEVARMMRDCDCGAIPVVEQEGTRRAIGMITDRDITIRIIAEGRNPIELTVREAMTSDAITVGADADIREAARLMETRQLRRLLVTEDGSGVMGILAQADIARSASEELVGELVEEISEPSHAGTH